MSRTANESFFNCQTFVKNLIIYATTCRAGCIIFDFTSAYNNIIMMADTISSSEVKFFYGFELVSMEEKESDSYYSLDIRGSVVNLYDEYGFSVADIEYDEYGMIKEKIANRESVNIFSYTGYIYEESIGAYYSKKRYYDPVSSRMLSEDPIRDGLNWYIYCNNNPINNIDPIGLAAVALREWFNDKLKYCQETYENISGVFDWNDDRQLDPRGSRAIMYTIEFFKNGKSYQLEVLYDHFTNNIWHFLYK